jgi:hypothetical protein
MPHPFEERHGIKPIRDPEVIAQMKRVADYGTWFLSQPEHYERYRGLVVFLYKDQVYATGRDNFEIMENARKRAAELGEPFPASGEWTTLTMPEYLCDEMGFGYLPPGATARWDEADPASS